MFSFNNYYNTEQTKRFYSPARIFYGEDSRNIVTDILAGKENILAVIDGYFLNDAFISTLGSQVKLLKEKIVVESEPDTCFMDKTIGLLKNSRVEWIIAVGGGSTIDTAKAIAAYYAWGSYWQIGYGQYKFLDEKAVVPRIIALPTTAGSGSESSRYYLIIDSTTREKMVCRSWELVPAYSILDPYFISDSNSINLIKQAFDAFCHLWETYICKYESSDLNDNFAIYAMIKILKIMDIITNQSKINESDILELQLAATVGGIALSNVRSGLMHDAGESLSALVKMPHPETLIVFYEEAFKIYSGNIPDKEEKLFKRIKTEAPDLNIDSTRALIDFWKAIFTTKKIFNEITSKLEGQKIDRIEIINKILADKVLLEKESPVLLDDVKIKTFVNESLAKFTKSAG